MRISRKTRGFTLIELLVVVAILGVLAAIVIPNVGKFIGSGKTEAAEVELHNVQLAINAAMAQEQIGAIVGAPVTLDNSHDVTVGTTTVGAFVSGGTTKLKGTYSLGVDGLASQTAYH